MVSVRHISPTLKWLIRISTICIWIVEALAAKEPLNADAVSYLNIANSCITGNWHALVNGYWSPGLPFLLSFWLRLFGANPIHHSLAMHLFAVVSLIVSLASFEWFLSVFFTYRKRPIAEGVEGAEELISDDAAWLMGFSLFFWITTFLIPPSLEQPDILVFILFLIASTLCMQLAFQQEWWRYALLGLILGVGYLIKAVLLPLGFVFLAALFLQNIRGRILSRLMLSVIVFAAVSLPFCIALSRSKNRFTFGDVGAINYQHIMGFDEVPLPQSNNPRPVAAPHVQEHSGSLQLGTYPPWADPSFGFKGAPLQFKFWRQVNRTHVVLRDYFNLYIEQLGALACGLLLLYSWSSKRMFVRRLLRQYVLWLPAIAGLAFYATMRVEGRFLAGYTLALFAAWIASVDNGESSDSARKLSDSVAIVVSALLLLQSAVQAGHESIKVLGHGQHADWQVSDTLHQMGVKPGDRVSYLGWTLNDHGWAYVAGVKIVSEIPEEDAPNFWAANEAGRAEALQWLGATGASALVTRNVPTVSMPMGWRKVGDTDCYILPLSGRNQAPPSR